MQISGIQKFSMLDYPGKISAIVFCQGCSLRCPYCHNKESLEFKDGAISEEEFFDFIEKRQETLDAIVFSGGEPTLQPDLKEKVVAVKDMGYLVGLHTSGINTTAFQNIVDLVDWVGFDVKTIFDKYDKVKGSGEQVLESFKILVNSKTEFEVRTTYDNSVVTEPDLFNIANMLSEYGIKKWFIQKCILRGNTEQDDVPVSLPSSEVIEKLSEIITVEIRK